MKKIVTVVTALVTLLTMYSCVSNPASDNDITYTAIENTENNTDPIVDVEYNYIKVESIQKTWQNCSSLISSQIEFNCSMWKICKYENSKNVKEDFNYYNSKSESYETIKQSLSLIDNVIKEEQANFDPELIPLLEKCSSSYQALCELFLEPSGSYDSYIEKYENAFDNFVNDYDEISSYLYKIGYYKEPSENK